MTFDQALKAKKIMGETITINRREHNVYIGPYDQDDFDFWKKLIKKIILFLIKYR